jgi:hypothetical protein
LLPLMMDLNWRRFQLAVQPSVQRERARDSRYEQLDSVMLYFAICLMLVVMESFVFFIGARCGARYGGRLNIRRRL